jgi:ArsR family transcriptional regulator
LGDIVRVLKALSNTTRFEIAAMLVKHGELCECEIADALAITQSKASRHLRELSSAGLVRGSRRGVWIYFSIDGSIDKETAGLLEALGPFMERLPSRPASKCDCKESVSCCGSEDEAPRK